MLVFQRIESVAIFVATVVAYHQLEFNWVWFVIFLLVPDVSMVAYLKDPKIGGFVYNLGHSYFTPIIIFGLSTFSDWQFGVTLSIIWIAHIAADRALGFGLKLPTGFKDTHLGNIGK